MGNSNFTYGLILYTVLKWETCKRQLCRELRGKHGELLMEQYSIDSLILKDIRGEEKTPLSFFAE